MLPPRPRSIGLVLLGALLATRPLGDPDVWWHLENGRQMLEQGTLTPLDDRAFTVPAAVRVNPSWLWDLLVAALHAVAGLAPVLLTPPLLVGLALALGLRATLSENRTSAALAGLLALPAFASRASPRPDTAALPLTAGLVLLLQGPPSRGRPIATFLLTAAWVQLHASFLVAILLLLPAARSRTAQAGLAGIAAGVLLHPAGPVALLETVLGQGDRSGGVAILEWAPPTLGFGLLCSVVLLLASLRPPRSWRLALPTLVVAVAAAGSARFVALATLLAWLLANTARPPRIPRWTGPLVLAVVLAGHLRAPDALPGFGVPELERPSGPLAAFPTVAGRGHVLTWFDIGAIVTWTHRDAWQVALDPRAELAFPDDVARATSDAFHGGEAWARFDHAWTPDAVLLPRDAPLCGELAASPSWTSPAFDANYTLFVRGPGPPSALDPCAEAPAQIRACKADPAHAAVPASAALAAITSDAGTARLAGMLALACGNDPDAARRWLDEAVRRDPRDAQARLARLLALRAMGEDSVIDALWLRWFRPDLL